VTRQHRGRALPCLYAVVSISTTILVIPKLTQLNPGIKTAIRTQNMHGRFTIVTLVGLIHVGLRKQNQARTWVIPLECDLVSIEESLLRNRVS
jgi:hypothetical protein